MENKLLATTTTACLNDTDWGENTTMSTTFSNIPSYEEEMAVSEMIFAMICFVCFCLYFMILIILVWNYDTKLLVEYVCSMLTFSRKTSVSWYRCWIDWSEVERILSERRGYSARLRIQVQQDLDGAAAAGGNPHCYDDDLELNLDEEDISSSCPLHPESQRDGGEGVVVNPVGGDGILDEPNPAREERLSFVFFNKPAWTTIINEKEIIHSSSSSHLLLPAPKMSLFHSYGLH